MASSRGSEDWIYLNHCIEDRDVGSVQQWFQQENDRSSKGVELFTNIRNPISIAAVAGDEMIFDLLVEAGFDPHTPDLLDSVWQRKPIHLAVSRGHEKLLTALINKYGVSLDTRDATGRSPLHWAAATGQAELIQMLIDSGASVNCAANEQSTPLHFAAEAGHGSACKILMSNSADVNLKDSKGLSPLHYAVRSQPKSTQLPSSVVANQESLC